MSWGRHLSIFTAILSLSAIVALQAHAGSVEGSITRLPPTSDATAPQDHYWKVWNGVLPLREAKESLADVTIAITGSVSGPPQGCDVSLTSAEMSPQTIVARSGSPLQVHNRDTIAHELSARGAAGLTRIEVAERQKQTVDVPEGGPWTIVDPNYAHLNGHLHSIPNLVACTTIGRNDKFRISDLDSGTYQLIVLRGAERLETKTIAVRNGGTSRTEGVAISMKRAD